MAKARRLTAARDWVLYEAQSIERAAEAARLSYILLGKHAEYSAQLDKVAKLRVIADIKSIHVRREALRNLGYIV